LKLLGPYKPIGAKSYRVKGVSRLDHEEITAEPENRLSRSAVSLTRSRNPKPRRVGVIQITIILWAGPPDFWPHRHRNRRCDWKSHRSERRTGDLWQAVAGHRTRRM